MTLYLPLRPVYLSLLFDFISIPVFCFAHSLHLCLALSVVKYTTRSKVIKKPRIQQSSFVALDLATVSCSADPRPSPLHQSSFHFFWSFVLFLFSFLSKCRQGRRGGRNSKTYQKIQSKGGNQKRKKP
ncbi:hypothetical protein J3F84DRAFT_264883 [Trichoderma pleuroticola]